jgi:hypothetical protein
MTQDRIFTGFLERQYRDGMALAASSDLLELTPVDRAPAVTTYFAQLTCIGLIRRAGQIVEHQDFVVGIRFTDDYLRRFETARVLTWCLPEEIWHPNIRPPFICAGHMPPGTPLVDLLYQVFEIITYHNVEMREYNALNGEACSWARNHTERFPLDRRPLRRPRRHQAGDHLGADGNE